MRKGLAGILLCKIPVRPWVRKGLKRKSRRPAAGGARNCSGKPGFSRSEKCAQNLLLLLRFPFLRDVVDIVFMGYYIAI
jgi:hypothetical protein